MTTHSNQPYIRRQTEHRARTLHEEALAADSDGCLKGIVALTITAAMWLHPFAIPPSPINHSAGTAAGCPAPAPAAVLDSAQAAEGYDAGTHWREIGIEDYSNASFIADAHLLSVRDYIASRSGSSATADEVALLLDTAQERAVQAGIAAPEVLLLACLAWQESRFDTDATGSAGERGLLQIHPCHKRAMRAAGLDFNREDDRLLFACMLYSQRGLKPWTTRKAAQRDFRTWGAV